jgi:hypothetical protein
MAARAAVSFVQQGCEMLREGQAIVKEFQDDAEGVVGQVTETVNELKELWAWVQGIWAQIAGLFGVQIKNEAPQPTLQSTAAPQKPVAKKAKRREPEPDAAILQMQVVHDVSQQLGKFFDLQQQIINHYAELEETSMHIYEEGQNHAMKAIERVEVELQMEEMTVLIRETMVYAPKELKDLYTRFLQMYGRIKDEQEFARQEQMAARRYKEASKWQRRNFRIEMGMWAVGLVWVVLILWGMLLELESLTGSLG